MPSAQPSDDLQPVVLIAPAMAIGSRYYRPLVEAFQAVGWDAEALPRRGFEPDEPRPGRRTDWSYADEIDGIATAVTRTRADRPGRPVLVLGHSLGGQLAAGHEVTRTPVDGVITVGASIPHFRHYPHGGVALLTMAGAIVPVTTSLFGYLPKPAFGGPGARTLMREWARMVISGRPPYPVDVPIQTPSLIVSLGGDELSPVGAVDAFAERLFAPQSRTRWEYADSDVPEGASNDHIAWVRSPGPVVDRIVEWWQSSRIGSEDLAALGLSGELQDP